MAHPNIEKLYKQIPSFECKPGCADCCGIVPWALSEWEPIADKREQTSENCPYISESNTCSIYNQRPFLCRLFGAGKDTMLKCPHGCGPEKPLPYRKARRLTNQYHELIDTASVMITNFYNETIGIARLRADKAAVMGEGAKADE